jgi:plasmid stabilization system protein ParE
MTAEPAFSLHPQAAQDITEIWEHIAADNLQAARRVREEIYSANRALIPSPHRCHPLERNLERNLTCPYSDTLTRSDPATDRCG